MAKIRRRRSAAKEPTAIDIWEQVQRLSSEEFDQLVAFYNDPFTAPKLRLPCNWFAFVNVTKGATESAYADMNWKVIEAEFQRRNARFLEQKRKRDPQPTTTSRNQDILKYVDKLSDGQIKNRLETKYPGLTKNMVRYARRVASIKKPPGRKRQ